MKSKTIFFHLYRSNPLFFRSVAVPGNFTLSELPLLCCIVTGLDPSACCTELHTEQMPSDDESAEAHALLPGMSGELIIARNTQTMGQYHLTMGWQVSEGAEENLQTPVLMEWSELQLPSGVFSVSIINCIQASLHKSSSYQAVTGLVYFKDQLQINLRKVENAINRQYAPELATAEIRTELGIPLASLLEYKTLQELRFKLDWIHMYGYNSERKPVCISALVYGLQRTSVEEIFADMEPEEYSRFRQLVTTGDYSGQTEQDLIRDFPTLYSYFRIVYDKKNGPLIAQEILENYETWFTGQAEHRFVVDKKIRQVMCWCAFYYGIFSIDHCMQVLQTVFPSEVSKEDLEAYWVDPPANAEVDYIHYTGKTTEYKHAVTDYAYDARVISEKNRAYYLAAVTDDTCCRKLPAGLSDFNANAIKSTNYLYYDLRDRAGYDSLLYAIYRNDSQLSECTDKIHQLRLGISAADVEKKLDDVLYWSYYSGYKDEQKLLSQYLAIAAEEMPQFMYYGFNRAEIREQQIHSPLLDRYTALLQEDAAKQAEARKAQKNKTKTAKRVKK